MALRQSMTAMWQKLKASVGSGIQKLRGKIALFKKLKDWLKKGSVNSWLLLLLSVMISLGGCATNLPSAPPSNLPKVPPLSVESSNPLPNCFQKAIDDYLINGDRSSLESCLNETSASLNMKL